MQSESLKKPFVYGHLSNSFFFYFGTLSEQSTWNQLHRQEYHVWRAIIEDGEIVTGRKLLAQKN
jgi:hypothetical protein